MSGCCQMAPPTKKHIDGAKMSMFYLTKITTLKQSTRTKRQKNHILMYLKIVNIDIITKTKNVFKSIELLADYRYSFCTH
jgi:hypothetical protein